MVWHLKILAAYLNPKWHLTRISHTWCGLDESSATTLPSFGGGQRLTITHNNIERVWERAAKPRKRKIRRKR